VNRPVKLARLDDDIEFYYRKSREAFLAGDEISAKYFYAKIRREHSVDLHYEIDLPEHILFNHPIGTVLGRCVYGDYLAVYQNVGVGGNLSGGCPEIGRGVVLFPGCKVLGDTKIGSNVFVQANTVIHNKEIPDNCIVYPFDGGCSYAPTKANVIRDVFRVTL